jgi:hypothetical protein
VKPFIDYWANTASVLGVFISIVGFIATIAAALKSKSAADQAKQEVTEVRRKLGIQSAVFDLNRIMNDIEELKPLHRAGAWDVLPTRYVSLRRQLLEIKMTFPGLSKVQRASIQGTIQQFSSIEQIVESAIHAKESPPDIPTLNRIAAEQADKLTEILVAVQKTIGA